MNWHQSITEKFFLATKRSAVFSQLAIFGAAKLIWWLGAVIFFWAILAGQIFPIASGVFFAWIMQLAIAYLFNRQRPFQKNHQKPLMELKWRTPAFPSGHTTLACAMAAGVFAQEPFFGGVFFFVAALVAFCRMAVGVHYFSDIIGGAVLGIGVAILVARIIGI